MPRKAPERRGVLWGRALWLVLSVGLALQGAYIFLFQRIPVGDAIMLATIALFVLYIGGLSGGALSRQAILGFRGSASIVFVNVMYGVLLLLWYRGGNDLEMFSPFLGVCVFFVVATGLVVFWPYHIYLTYGLSLAWAFIGLVHAVSVNFSTYQVGVGNSAERYGFVDGVNIVNVTGLNLSLMFLSAYVVARAPVSKLFVQAACLMALLSLAAPLVATGSRAAFLIVILGVAIFETRLLAGGAISRFLIALAGAASFAGLALSYFPDLYSYAAARLDLMGGASDGATAARLENLSIALSLELPQLLLGTGHTGAEFLGWSPDNAIANILISSGIVGVILTVAALFRTAWDLMRIANIGLGGMALLLQPLVIRAMGEGNFLSLSALFPTVGFFIAVMATHARVCTFNKLTIADRRDERSGGASV